MALIEDNLVYGKINKVEKAIERIRLYSEASLQLTSKPYYVGYSGGKDSDAIRILCSFADVPHELVHNHTTIDAPETVNYIRTILPPERINKPIKSMWELIVEKGIPPTRIIRYCCPVLKEKGGKDRFVMTGVRWAESNSRKKNRGSLELLGSKKENSIILNSDNNENRHLFESCIKKKRRILNPIIDWTDEDVWEFLSHYGCKSNPLYEMGYKRVGCVGCPMASKTRYKEFRDFPKYKNMYIKAFDKMIKINSHIDYTWKSGEEVFDWWLNDKTPPKQAEGQLSLLEE
jgi:phosphoadenosine phosphosulfate reductase